MSAFLPERKLVSRKAGKRNIRNGRMGEKGTYRVCWPATFAARARRGRLWEKKALFLTATAL